MNRQSAVFNKVYAYNFEKEYPKFKSQIYCDLSNTIKPTGLKNLPDSEIFKTIQSFNGDNISEKELTLFLTETYLRLKNKEKTYPADSINFVNSSDGSYGMHYWANIVSEKMAIDIFNPKRYYESMNKYDKSYNKENIGICVLSTMIHETAHDTQCAKINQMLNGKTLSPQDRVMALTYLSSTCKLIEIPYTNQYIEFDANYKAITTIYENIKNGNLKNDYNNKLNLYNDILICLHSKKENVKEDNTKYYMDLKDTFAKIKDKNIQDMVKTIDKNDIEVFNKTVDSRYEEINEIRRILEKDLAKNITTEMKVLLNQKDEKFISNVLENDNYNASESLKFKQLLSSIYSKAHLEKQNKEENQLTL